MPLRPLATLLAVSLLAQPMAAQDSASAGRDERGAAARLPHLTFALLAGTGEVHARTGGGATVADASIYSLAIRWEKTILRAGRFALAYRAELMPLVYGSAPRVADSYGSCINGVLVTTGSGGTYSACPAGSPVGALGTGGAPIGLTASFAIPGGITAFADGNGGMILFHRDFPINGSGLASYLLGYGFGVSVPVGGTRTIVAGYRMQTFSNGYVAIENPAMRTGVFQLGLGLASDARRTGDDGPPIDHATALTWTAGVGVGAFDAVAKRYSVSARLVTLSARWERTFLRTSGGTELRFAMDAIPVAVAETGDLPDFAAPACRVVLHTTVDPANCPGVVPAEDPAFAIGGSPFIINYSFRGPGRIRLYAEGNAGGLLFSRDFPIGGSRHASFLLGAGGGVEIPVSATRALVVGYKLQHLSNGYTAARNPGMNLHYVSLGVAVRH